MDFSNGLKRLNFLLKPFVRLFCPKCLAIFGAVCVCDKTCSQGCSLNLEVEVLDRNEGTPINNAILSTQNEDHEIKNSNQGTTIIQNICPGKLQLMISHPNYEVYLSQYSIDSDKTLKIELIRKAIELNPVNIEQFLHPSESQTLSEKILTQSQIDAYSHQNISDVLSTLSGVSLVRIGNEISKPIIHGMYGSRVAIVADGHRLSDQEWGSDHSPSIDLNAYEGVQLLKGVATLKYGGGTPGGIIILNQPIVKPIDSLYGSISVVGSSNGLGGSLASRIIKSYQSGFHFKINGSYKRTRDFIAPNYTLSNTASSRQNVGIHVVKKTMLNSWEFTGSVFKNEIGILRAAHTGNVRDLIIAINRSRPWLVKNPTFEINSPSQNVTHYSAFGKYSKRFDATSKFNILYGFQHNRRKEFDIRRAGRSKIPSLHLRLITQNISIDYERFSKGFWDFNMGTTFELQDNEAVPGTGVSPLIPDYFRYKIGSYISATYKKNNDLIFELGARLDYDNLDVKKFYQLKDWENRKYSEKYSHFEIRKTASSQILTNPKLDFWSLGINSGVYKNFKSNISISLNHILSQRTPNVAELFSDGLHHSLATIEQGNLELRKESIHKTLMDINKNSGKLQWGITPYFALAENYIYLKPIGAKTTIRGAFPIWEYLSTDAQFWGIDVDLEYQFKRNMTYQSTVSYVAANESKTKTPLLNIPPFSLNQRLNYRAKSNFSFQVTSDWIAKQNRYLDTTFKSSYIQDGQFVQTDINLTSPVKSYHLLGLEIRKKFINKKNFSIESGLRVQNLMNLSYREYLNRLRYFSDDIGRSIELRFQIDF